DEKTASARQLGKLIAQLRELLARSGIATPATEALLQRVDIRTEFYGSGYALPAPGAAEAIARFTERQHGTRADLAYSGKALACFYQDLDRGHLPTPALYWHTYSAQALPPGVTRAAREQVPEALRGYWS
ncbi:MAG TPA: hypothetical protein VHE37_12920, partial [Nevskiaceae bacterium]|nr:hypothetical protein [Nevskiaceae bacterium]